MSIASQISRIQTDRNTIRNKLIDLGLATSTDNLDTLANAVAGITNQGAVSAEILEGTSYTIPAGYHNGSGTVKAMTDTVGEAEKYKTQAKTVTPTKQQQSVTPASGYYALESVTVNPIPDAYQDVSSVTAGAGDVLAGKVIVDATGAIKTGTMANNGTVKATIVTGKPSFTIPAGYHSGSGTVSISPEDKSVTPTKAAQDITATLGNVLNKVTVNPIPDEYQDVTGVTTTAEKVLTGSAFVDSTGAKVNGTMVNNGSVKKVMDCSDIGSDHVCMYMIPAGYHKGDGYVEVDYEAQEVTPSKKTITVAPGCFMNKVTVNPIPDAYQDVTAVNAEAAHVLAGKKIVDATGTVVTGAMANNGNVSKTLDGLTTASVTIPAGYTSGGTVSLTADIEEALAAI